MDGIRWEAPVADAGWPEMSCWLAAELVGLPDRRTAVLGDFLALAEAGHLDVAAHPDRYDVQVPVSMPEGLPAEHAEMLYALASGPEFFLRAPVRERLGKPAGNRIRLGRLRVAGRRSAARLSYTRRPLPGLSRTGTQQRQRLLDLPDRLPSAPGDPAALPWARLFLGDDEFGDWYDRHLERYGPPGWLTMNGTRDGDPSGPDGVRGLFVVLAEEMADGDPKPAPGARRDFFVPHGERAAPVAAPITEQHPWAGEVAAAHARARAGGSGDALFALTDVDAVTAMIEQAHAAGDEGAAADAEERLLALTGLVPGADETTRAAGLAARRRAGPSGELFGLSLALWAHVMVVAGRAGQGRSLGDQAVHLLAPGGTAGFLAFAYDAVAAASFRSGRFLAAERALTAGAEVLRPYADSHHREDLARFERLLGDDGLRLVAGPGLDEADRSYAAGVALGGTDPAAAWESLAAARQWFDEVWNPRIAMDALTRWHRSLLRRGGRAHWRSALVAHTLGRAGDVAEEGRRAIWCFERARPADDDDGRSDWAAESMTVIGDVAQLAVLGGDTDRGLRLIADGIAIGKACPYAHRPARRALGTLLHNRADTMAGVIVERGGAAPYTLGEAGRAIATAAEIRESLAGVDPLAVWELANTYLLASKIAALGGNHRVAVEMVCRTGVLCADPGGAAGALRGDLAAVAGTLADLAPAEVAAARAAGRWPR
ncbi:hypothetical protein Aph02nite_94380 [Actinoplanes philippinensis]|uniref:Uncharacterized protein n=1 Tax=Actinoplanes philippinensis TaxID=35752 RepID=A0A1I2NHU9_9ACTN|nr:hypothetical protein [Actinoplanes philippinensis]GIE83488.1 hypothetical protein Aph02nite_94380 [Actinoplanes philippinensis]SFG01257.1 hypothetical protein SAMN05421541_1439 [Actinoplanes philippinensis]